MRSSYQVQSGLFAENYTDQRYLATRLSREGGDLYVAIYTVRNTSSGGPERDKVNTLVEVVEVRPMQGKVEVVRADRMALDISTQGRIALYGIYFDTGTADIKAESAPTLEEIARLLRTQPALRLNVVGHTDNQGALPFNLDLSKRRAEAVVIALSGGYGIAAGRLAAHGVAFLAPVASNRNEVGRARNRRVELSEP
jgi:outer membrane protein OmpA-like peptidoglycan-associated protein